MDGLSSTMNDCRDFLKDFGIKMTPEIQHKIIENYPNDIAIENYIRSIVIRHLDALDGM